jgi:hypothetical protein
VALILSAAHLARRLEGWLQAAAVASWFETREVALLTMRMLSFV